MLCFTAKSYTRLCSPLSGGISDILFFDPSDFNFTQATADSGYSAMTRKTGATEAGGALLYPVSFLQDDDNGNGADRTWKHSLTGCSTKYAHEIHAQLPQLSNDLTNFLQSLDSAGCCCGLGVILRHRDGKKFVMGEKYVNNTEIPVFKVKMNGSDGASGKVYQDFNGVNVLITGSYSRDLREFTGDWSAIQAFMSTGTVTPTTFDTALTFVSSTTDTDADVTGTAAATDADLKFEFNLIASPSGLPNSMSITVGGVEQLTVDYLDDYEGTAFKFTDTAGAIHTGVFTNGTVAF